MSSSTMETQSSISRGASNTIISADPNPEAFEDLLEYHVQKQNEMLRKTFIWQSASRRASALSTLKRNSVDRNSRSKGEPLATMEMSQDARPQNTGTGVDKSGSLSEVETHEKLRKTFSYQPSSQQATALRSLGQSQDRAQLQVARPLALDSKGPQLKPKAPVIPMQRLSQQARRKTRLHLEAKVAPQRHILPVDTDGQGEDVFHDSAPSISNSSTLRGSEDLIVPEREDDNESDGEEETVGGVQRHLDFTNFAFTPK